MNFQVLNDYFNPENLLLAYHRVSVWPEVLIKDVVGLRAYENNLEENLKYLSDKICSGQFKPQRPFKYYEPKASGTHRTKSMLMVEDALLYQAIANILATRNYDKLEAHNSFIFGSVLHPETKLGLQLVRNNEYLPPFYFFQHWRPLFEQFSSSVIKAIEKDKAAFKFETDITGFFDSIPHYNLLEILGKEFNVEEEILDLMSDCLNIWSGTRESLTPGVGIPQGPQPSYLLANMFLYPLDKQLIGKAYKYFRYMDDLKIYSYTEDALRDALVVIDIYLKGSGLSINSKKTAITPIVNHEKDPTVKELKKMQFQWAFYEDMDDYQSVVDEINEEINPLLIQEPDVIMDTDPEDLLPDFPEDYFEDPVDFPILDYNQEEEPWPFPDGVRTPPIRENQKKVREILAQAGVDLSKIPQYDIVNLNGEVTLIPRNNAAQHLPSGKPTQEDLLKALLQGGHLTSGNPEKSIKEKLEEIAKSVQNHGGLGPVINAQPRQSGFPENSESRSNDSTAPAYNEQLIRELELLTQQTPADQSIEQVPVRKEYLSDPEKIIEFFENEIKIVEDKLTALFDKDQKKLINETEIMDIDFIRLSSRFGTAVGKLQEYKDYTPPEKLLPLWIFAFRKYFWRARNFVLTLKYYKGNSLLKETLLEHYHSMRNYEFVRFHTINCLNYSFEFCDAELRKFYNMLTSEASDLVKYSLYSLIIRHNEDFQLLAALRSQLSAEKNAYLKLWVAYYWDQVEKKLLSRDELMKLAGL